MKILLSPKAKELIEDPLSGPFMKIMVEEAVRTFGFEIGRDNPFGLPSKCWDESCPLAIHHNKEGEYALLYENPHHPGVPRLPEKYFEELLPLCVEYRAV
jgi:hypothetical protein